MSGVAISRPSNRRPSMARWPALALVPLALTACASPTASDPPPNLAVGGYVTLDLNPTFGVARLVTPEGVTLASSLILNGRYEVSAPVEAGIVVCDGYSLHAEIAQDGASRSAQVVLDASTGRCVMPSDASLYHNIDYDFPR